MNKFEKHSGYSRTFRENKLTLGLAFPIEAYQGNVPKMDLEQQIKLAKVAEKGNFASLFVRDIPLNDPLFGDAGQMYDPWVFLSHIAAHTKEIALGTASAITSFQHPLNLAKTAASLDKISGERLLFGLATGDRPIEFSAFGVNREKRAEIFQEALYVMREAWGKSFPVLHADRVNLTGVTDILPKPVLGDIPIFVTGFSGQSLGWIAENGDGWLGYPRNPAEQKRIINDYRSLTDGFKPFTQGLVIDLSTDPGEGPTPMHLGFRSGHKFLNEFLNALQEAGVNHVMIGLKNARRPADEIIQELAEEVVPYFPAF
ncbi:5,10-methylene tetrahydromethanopterin reductase [Mesobacillus campisalis]|uniref:5,10-methylene tetrahydromethanopterin reductase n=1 Tax=Mesobacillus campisalis TaxID=1408103 RepID=A0A0M2SP99_9BACI|nr:LLM class oxidoreductase [Mesobacillus campisalis]KKK34445.1 5,10-methylene tetrahydromethanopterin reductase [Mesobacillus campisalis]